MEVVDMPQILLNLFRLKTHGLYKRGIAISCQRSHQNMSCSFRSVTSHYEDTHLYTGKGVAQNT